MTGSLKTSSCHTPGLNKPHLVSGSPQRSPGVCAVCVAVQRKVLPPAVSGLHVPHCRLTDPVLSRELLHRLAALEAVAQLPSRSCCQLRRRAPVATPRLAGANSAYGRGMNAELPGKFSCTYVLPLPDG